MADVVDRDEAKERTLVRKDAFKTPLSPSADRLIGAVNLGVTQDPISRIDRSEALASRNAASS
jgi:hypothetical protein